MKVSEWKALLETFPDQYQIDGMNLVVMDARNVVLGPLNGHGPTVKLPPHIQQILEEKRAVRLDLGCGKWKQSGPDWVGIDERDLPGVDIVWNLLRLPWPLPDACASIILASHLVEHIPCDKIMGFMNESWRVLKGEGQMLISTPYAGSFGFWQDPTHVHGWNQATVRYFIKGEALYDIYEPKPWKLELCEWTEAGNLEIRIAKLAEASTDAD